MKAFLKNRKVACILTLVIIFLSTIYGNHRSLLDKKTDAELTFVNGVYEDGFSIQNDLNEIINSAYNLVTIGKKYLPEKDAILTQVLDAREQLSQSKTPSEKYDANQKILETTTDLYDTLAQYSLSDKDSRLRTREYTTIISRNDTIKNDLYNEEAEKFNALLKTFPNNLLSKITLIAPIELFQ